MAALETPLCNFGEEIKDFTLPNVDGKNVSVSDAMGEKGLLIAFICNHCPFVKAINEKLVMEAAALRELGVNMLAINSNDTINYPADSFENMQITAKQEGYTFPYLFDESQDIAKAYGAICTPDFFGYNSQGELQYRGRLDSSGRFEADEELTRDLYLAMKQIAETGKGPKEQKVSIGCSIKWRP